MSDEIIKEPFSPNASNNLQSVSVNCLQRKPLRRPSLLYSVLCLHRDVTTAPARQVWRKKMGQDQDDDHEGGLAPRHQYHIGRGVRASLKTDVRCYGCYGKRARPNRRAIIDVADLLRGRVSDSRCNLTSRMVVQPHPMSLGLKTTCAFSARSQATLTPFHNPCVAQPVNSEMPSAVFVNLQGPG